MTNYEKYAGDMSRLADMIMGIEEGINDMALEFCTERCIIDWLQQEVTQD